VYLRGGDIAGGEYLRQVRQAQTDEPGLAHDAGNFR
jgi:hypothetical protein